MSRKPIEELSRRNKLTCTVGIGSKPLPAKYANLSKENSIDYSAIKQAINDARKEGSIALGKIKSLKKNNQEIQEKRLGCQHFEVWQITARQLMREYNYSEIDLENFYFTLLEKDLEVFKPIIQSVKFFEDNLHEDFNKFLNGVVLSVKNLSSDVKLTAIEHEKCEIPFEKEHSTAIKKEISRVRDQSSQISKALQSEQNQYQEEINEICEKYQLTKDYTNFLSVEELQNIPIEIQQLEWPDDFVLQEVLQEFQELTENYLAKFQHLEVKYGPYKSQDFTLSNSKLDKAKFIMGQYDETSIANRRSLMLDRLEKEFPNMSKFEVRNLTSWHSGLKTYEFQKKLLIKSFFNSKHEFIGKTLVHNEESWTSFYECKQEKIAKEQRKKERYEFLMKLRDWKMKRLDLLKVENDLAQKEASEMEAQHLAELEAKERDAKMKKEKVQMYQKECKLREEQEQIEAEKDFKKAKKELALQIKNEKEKIQKRYHILDEKADTRKMQEFEKTEIKLRKQEIQNLITQKISDKVSNDPERVHQKTQSYTAKFDASKHDQDLQTPLFKVETFASDTVTSDPRIRLEIALREAGLHNTQYARTALQMVSPMKQPRHAELQSNVFPSNDKIL